MRILPLLTSAVLLAGFSPALCAAESLTVDSFHRTITKTVGYTYLLSLPAGYDAGAKHTWPLLVFLHGAAERGADPWLVARNGPPKLIRSAASGLEGRPAGARTPREESARLLTTSFIVVSPQCPAGKSWDDDGVLALIDEISAKHRVDPRRIYLTGLSLGGFGTWSAGLKNPGRFAAIVPVCGGGQRFDIRRAAREKPAELLSLGIWAFHGAKDPLVPLEESETMVAELKKAGVSDVKLTVYPEAEHDSWSETYRNPGLYAWLLQHERTAPPAESDQGGALSPRQPLPSEPH
ncbi:MAG: prolyl oligopeptidase family serine peptidase [Verrucomicrobiota bacterium]